MMGFGEELERQSLWEGLNAVVFDAAGTMTLGEGWVVHRGCTWWREGHRCLCNTPTRMLSSSSPPPATTT